MESEMKEMILSAAEEYGLRDDIEIQVYEEERRMASDNSNDTVTIYQVITWKDGQKYMLEIADTGAFHSEIDLLQRQADDGLSAMAEALEDN